MCSKLQRFVVQLCQFSHLLLKLCYSCVISNDEGSQQAALAFSQSGKFVKISRARSSLVKITFRLTTRAATLNHHNRHLLQWLTKMNVSMLCVVVGLLLFECRLLCARLAKDVKSMQCHQTILPIHTAYGVFLQYNCVHDTEMLFFRQMTQFLPWEIEQHIVKFSGNDTYEKCSVTLDPDDLKLHKTRDSAYALSLNYLKFHILSVLRVQKWMIKSGWKCGLWS